MIVVLHCCIVVLVLVLVLLLLLLLLLLHGVLATSRLSTRLWRVLRTALYSTLSNFQRLRIFGRLPHSYARTHFLAIPNRA